MRTSVFAFWLDIFVGTILLVGLSGCQQSTRDAAANEARVIVYSSTDEPFFGDVIRAFEKANPKIRVEYHALTAREVNQRYLSETAVNRPTADLLINSAMDLQVKLANDGHARTYSPPEPGSLPGWASWNNRAYAVSVEPIVFGVNKREVGPAAFDSSRSGLAKFVRDNSAKLKGRVGLYDPETSSLGMLLVNQDIRIDHENWDLIATLGRNEPRLYVSTRDMINDVAKGKLLVAYNIIGSYAFQRAKLDPAFAVIVPHDYTLLMSRVAIIPKEARHPNAAALLMDYLLSRDGQQLFARRGMSPVRTDVEQPYPELARSNVRAVRVGPALLSNMDTMNRDRLLNQWRATLSSGRVPE